MKKSLSLLLAIALVFGMFSASAFAAEQELTLQQQFDALKAAGIFNGYPPNGDPGFERDMTRAEFAKVAVLLLGKAENASANKFADVPASHWAAGYIGAAAEAGLVNGVGLNKFLPNGKITIEQVAKILVEALGLQEASASVGGAQSDWAKGYVASAVQAGLIKEQANWKANAKRDLLVSSAYQVYQQTSIRVTGHKVIDANTVEVTFSDNEKETVKLTTALEAGKATTIQATHKGVNFPVVVTLEAPALDVAATGAKVLTLKFNQAVDTTKATITVKRGANTLSAAAPVWSEDKKTATVTLASKMIAGTYDVTVKGVGTTDLTDSVTVEGEKVTKIEITSDVAPLAAADALTVAVPYKVTNQYGEDITNVTNVIGSSSGGDVTAANGTATIDPPGAITFTLGQSITLTLIQPEAVISTTKTLTVSAMSRVADISVTGIYNADNKTLNADSTGTDFYLLVDAKDQYGNAVTNITRLRNEVLVTVSNPTVATLNTLANNRTQFTTVQVDGQSKPAIQLGVNPEAGTSVVTLIAEGTGRSTTYTINVANGLKVDNITFGEPALAAAGETVKVPVTVTDLAGNAVTDVDQLNKTKANGGIDVTGIAGTFKKVDNEIVYEFTAPGGQGTTNDTFVSVTAITANNKVAVKTITIRAEANPKVIVGVKSDIKRLVYKNEYLTFTAKDLLAEDQYGRAMSGDDLAADLANGDYRIVVSQGSSDPNTGAIDLMNDADNDAATNGDRADVATLTLINGNTLVALQGIAKGSEDISFKLQNNGNDVAGSSATVSFRTVELGELSGFGAEDLANLRNDADYAKNLEVYGTLSNGQKVVLPASAYTVVSNSKAVINGNNISAENFTNADIGDDKVEKFTVIVTINDNAAQFNKELTATSVAATANKLEIRNPGPADGAQSTMNLAIGNAPFDMADIASRLFVEDQYGVQAASVSAAGVVTYKETTTEQARLLISDLKNANGNATAPTVVANGTKDATVNNLEVGDSFKVTVTVGSKSASITVNVVA